MAIASAGNLAISQSVLSTLTEGLEDPHTGEVETLMNAPTMFQAAQRIGRAIRNVHATEGEALKSEDVSFDVSFLFGGQIPGDVFGWPNRARLRRSERHMTLLSCQLGVRQECQFERQHLLSQGR